MASLKSLSNNLKTVRKRDVSGSSKKPQVEKLAIRDSLFHRNVKPKNGYFYFSDYFQIDKDKYGSVLMVQNNEGSDMSLAPFWGLSLSLMDLGDGFEDVSIRFLNQVSRRDDNWVKDHLTVNERVSEGNKQEAETFNKGEKYKTNEKNSSFDEVSTEIARGASYLDVRMAYLIKAPNLEILDEAVRKINFKLRLTFDTVNAVARDATQRDDFTHLLRSNVTKLNKQFGFTSDEFAGFANLVTQGINDLTGQYVGQMTEDVNNSAVIFDIDNYKHSVVIASDGKAQTLSFDNTDFSRAGNLKGSDMWGVKLVQEALKENHKVVEFVFNGINVMNVGADLSSISSVVDMDQGDLNPFEFFGEKHEELGLMSEMVSKLTLMFQLVGNIKLEGDNAVFQSEAAKVIDMFYTYNGMWTENPNDPIKRQSVRLVGLPHEEYPKLNEFATYVDDTYKGLLNNGAYDTERVSAVNKLEGIVSQMLKANSDLFDVSTKNKIDSSRRLPRVVYDFKSLRRRGTGMGVAMAQFVNVLGYAVSTLNEGDVVVFHGAEFISDTIKKYVGDAIDSLYDKRVRVVFIYGNVDKMLKDTKFNELDKADYLMLGTMTPNDIAEYQRQIGVTISEQLAKTLVNNDDNIWYLRRSFENVIFGCDISLGMGLR